MEITKHQLAVFYNSTYTSESTYRSVMCSSEENGFLWDTLRALDFYFGINEESSLATANELHQMVGEVYDVGGHNPALADLADCCEEEAVACCSSCSIMVPFDTLKDAIKQIEVARQNLCSEEAILRAEGTWKDLVRQAQFDKWDHPTERGESCIDPADCDTNRHHRGKSWCYTNSTRVSLPLRRPWDYCMPSVGYMCAVRGLDCNATLTMPRCSLALDIESCLQMPGCAFKGSKCVPVEFELLSSSRDFSPDVENSNERPSQAQWQQYYSLQLDLLFAQVAAGQRDYSDAIEVCSRLPFEHCLPPCTRHGFGSNIQLGQINPWQSRFGYCSLHGHYRAKPVQPGAPKKLNSAVEAMQAGSAELGLKLFNIGPVALSVFAFRYIHPDCLFPDAFAQRFHSMVNPLQLMVYDVIEHSLQKIFFTLGRPIPGILQSIAFLHVVKGPIVEEVVFRGIVQGAVRLVADAAVLGLKDLAEGVQEFEDQLEQREVLERYVFAVTQLITAWAFAYIHVLNGEENAVIQAVFCFWNGLVLQLVHHKFGLSHSFLAHFANNAIAELVGTFR